MMRLLGLGSWRAGSLKVGWHVRGSRSLTGASACAWRSVSVLFGRPASMVEQMGRGCMSMPKHQPVRSWLMCRISLVHVFEPVLWSVWFMGSWLFPVSSLLAWLLAVLGIG